MANKCKECGCFCKKCLATDHDVQLHVEIENLKQKMLEKENHIVMMETNFLNEANKFPSGEFVALREELLTWQDKYKRLYEAHRRVQRVNQGLEDKLLKLVDVCETDKNTLTKDVAILSHKLAEANYAIKKLTEDNERYKNDVNLAIQFLQCKQTNFVAHRFDSLPSEVQTQVAAYMTNKRKPLEEPKRAPMEPKSIKVPIPTFPPTAMVYSVPKSPKDRAAVEGGRRQQGDEGTQTGNASHKSNLCLKCNDVITSLTQPTALQIIKPIDDKKLPPYPNLVVAPLVETSANQNPPQNVVKVQPNNFLIEKALSEKSEQKDMIDFNDITVVEINEKATVHHKLCDQKVQSFNVDLLEVDDGGEEKRDLEKRLQETPSNDQQDTPKGPRYASLRLQTGSKNILLDNAHNNIAPVLYTRTHNNPSSQAKCYRSQKKNEKPHSLHLKFASVDLMVEAHCTCEAGNSESCNHVVGLAYFLQHLILNGFKEVPESASCTSIPMEWNKPRGNKITAEKIPESVFIDPNNIKRTKKPVICQIKNPIRNDELKKINQASITNLKTVLKEINPSIPFASTLCTENMANDRTILLQNGINVPASSLLGHMARAGTKNVAATTGLERDEHLDDLPIALPLDDKEMVDILISLAPVHHASLQPISMEQAAEIEKKTRTQNQNDLWKDLRKFRFTASKFGFVCRRKLFNDEFIKPFITAQKNQPESSKLPIETSSASSLQSKRRMSVVSENSTQHQQRINDWVQITVENDNVSSPDNSRTEDLKIDPQKDKARFAEMEENVKRFLFGESDFWKTVEIGKLKYQSYQEGEKKPKLGSREGPKFHCPA
ncbi:unnamed protein product [Ceutorhynchus assimilis]|uniref:SWIM-type domain-containing protein n=1 Tax=Ceutorhynchus assimilis TaxID=467358 RepID=A0A9N9MJB6_9CUCU|nr:unnamed protein product [Ceutorhynchus assimilis]